MLTLVVTAAWWLLASQSVALPAVGTGSSSAAPTVINSGSNSTDNQTLSNLSKDGSISAFNGSVNGTAAHYGRTSVNNSSATTPSSRSYTVAPGSDDVNAVPATSGSTASGASTPSTAVPDYALTFAELLSALTAEFVFNVAGDHVLFPVGEDRDADQRLHADAVVVAELLQRLHLTADVHRVLNASSCAVAEQLTKRTRRRDSNPVAAVLRLTTEAAALDPLLRDEYLATRQRLANQINGLPAQHGQFAASRSQTLYDVTGEQLAYAERLMADVRVKKLIMCVTFFKASQFEEAAVPEWVRGQTSLAKAVFRLAKRPEWRDEMQRLFDEAVNECTERFDAMAGDDELIFQAMRDKVEKNASLNAALQKVGSQLAQTNT